MVPRARASTRGVALLSFTVLNGCYGCDVPMVADIISHRRLRWLGHVGRMSRDRMPLQLMF